MSTSNSQPVHEARATAVAVSDDAVTVELDDGRVVSAPLAWYPRLLHGTREERERWRLTGDGEGIHWPNLDEDIEVDQLVAGKPSGESQQSLKRWVEERQARRAQA